MTVSLNTYSLTLGRGPLVIKLPLKANDSNHAQAQASDICRSVDADRFNLCYEQTPESNISKLFQKLAFSDFSYDECFTWDKPYCNNTPCFYLFSKRFYVRQTVIKYMDIPVDLTIKNTCKNKQCVNPYHFTYLPEKNSKMTGGDLKMLVAYRSQGTDVNQLAKAFNVHRSTIYRKLKNERVSIGDAGHR